MRISNFARGGVKSTSPPAAFGHARIGAIDAAPRGWRFGRPLFMPTAEFALALPRYSCGFWDARIRPPALGELSRRLHCPDCRGRATRETRGSGHLPIPGHMRNPATKEMREIREALATRPPPPGSGAVRDEATAALTVGARPADVGATPTTPAGTSTPAARRADPTRTSPRRGGNSPSRRRQRIARTG